MRKGPLSTKAESVRALTYDSADRELEEGSQCGSFVQEWRQWLRRWSSARLHSARVGQ
jgi:hypothetical protein